MSENIWSRRRFLGLMAACLPGLSMLRGRMPADLWAREQGVIASGEKWKAAGNSLK